MKNVMIFQNFVNDVTYGHQWKTKELFNYFKSQVDNSLRLGWKAEDIVICTNLDFEYKGITIIKMKEECKFNKYFNKQFGIWELLDRKLITEPFWFHDFDDWPLEYFDFPEFDGDIGMGKYIDGQQWNTGSIFVKPSSVDIWELMVDFMKQNRDHQDVDNKGDENIVNMVYHLYSQIQHRFSLLNNQYNVGCTQFDMRYNSANKPIFVGAFKPNESKDITKFEDKNLIDKDMFEIFRNHSLLENQEVGRKIFIDGGAASGMSVDLFRRHWKDNKEYEIHSFECHPRFKNDMDNINNIIFHDEALWIYDGEIDFYSGDWLSSTLIKEKQTGNINTNSPIKVKCIDLSKWILENFKGRI